MGFEWVTQHEAAKWLNVSLRTLRRHASKGRLQSRHVTKRNRRGEQRQVVMYKTSELAKLPKRRVAHAKARPKNPGEVTPEIEEALKTLCILITKELLQRLALVRR